MERGLWIGVFVGLLVIVSVFAVGFYSGNVITGNAIFDFWNEEDGTREVAFAPEVCDGSEITLKLGESIQTKLGKFKLDGVDDDSALVTLVDTGDSDAINVGDIEALNGIRIQVFDLNNDEDDSQDWAIIKVCGVDLRENNNMYGQSSLPACIYTDESDAQRLFAQNENMSGSEVCSYFNNMYRTFEGKSYTPVAYTLERGRNHYLKADNCDRPVYDFGTYDYETRSADLFGLKKLSPIVFSNGVGMHFGSDNCIDYGGSAAYTWKKVVGVWCCVAEAPEYIPG